MRTPEQEQLWLDWVATRPKAVRAMCMLYPPGTAFDIHGQIMYLVGYRETESDVLLLVSETNPAVDYQKATNSGQPICACCIPKLEKKI